MTKALKRCPGAQNLRRYVMLYTHSSDLALSPKFRWPGFNQYFYSSPWALNIRLS